MEMDLSETDNFELDKLRNDLREEKLAYRNQQREFILKKARSLRDDPSSQDINEYELKKIAMSLRNKSQVTCESLSVIMNTLLESELYITAFLSVDGALQALLRALSGKDENLQLIAARCICNLAFGNEKKSLQVLKAAESYLFAHLSGRNHYVMEACALAIGNFSMHGPKHIQLLIEQGFFQKITQMLSNPDENLQEAAIYALTQLIYHGFDSLSSDQLHDTLAATIPIFKTRSFSAAFLMSLFSAQQDCQHQILLNDIHIHSLKYLLNSLNTGGKEALAYLRILSNCVCDSSGKATTDLVKDHFYELKDCVRCLLLSKKDYLQKECLALIGNILNHSVGFEMHVREIINDNFEIIQLLKTKFVEDSSPMIT